MKYLSLLVFLGSLLAWSVNAEQITSFGVSNELLLGDVPVVHVEVELDKTRDLHVAVQDADNNWKQVASTMKRVKKSGRYHFKMPIKNLKVGHYKWNAYITPRGKDWNHKIGKSMSQNMQVVKVISEQKANAASKTKMSQQDVIQKIDWPATIKDNKQYVLTIKYAITQARDLHVILFNKKGWKKLGNIKVTVGEPGEITVPLGGLLDEYGEGDYAWAARLTLVGTEDLVGKKLGKHFQIISK